MNPLVALTSRDFRIYWLGSLFAMFGHRLIIVAISLLIFRLTGSAISLGIVAAASAIPIMFFNLIGGTIADKYNVRIILFLLSFFLSLTLAFLAFIDVKEIVEPIHVYIICVLLGILLGIDFPARNSYFPRIIPNEYLKSGITLNGATFAGSSVIVPTIGGLLIVQYGSSIGIFLSSLGYLIMCFSTFFLPNVKVKNDSSNHLKFFTEGLRYIKNNELFYSLILVTYFTNFFIFGYIQALPAFIDIFNGTARELGFMFSSAGIGALTGLLTAGNINIKNYLGIKILLSACMFSLFIILVSLSTNILYIFPLALIGHFFNGFTTLSIWTILQHKVPEHIRGRVMGILAIHISLGVLGGLWVGGLGELFNIRLGMTLGPIICLLFIGYLLSTKKSIRNLKSLN